MLLTSTSTKYKVQGRRTSVPACTYSDRLPFLCRSIRKYTANKNRSRRVRVSEKRKREKTQ